jgi:hypothetical protein
MSERRSGANPVTRGLARLMVGATTGVLDAVLGLATAVRAHYTEREPLPVPRRTDWWNTPEPTPRDAPSIDRSSRRSRRSFPTERRG